MNVIGTFSAVTTRLSYIAIATGTQCFKLPCTHTQSTTLRCIMLHYVTSCNVTLINFQSSRRLLVSMVCQFRDGLKSHLFADAYFWSSENIHYKSVMYLLTYLLYIGDRSFATAGPRLWNSLPADVRSALSLTTFRQKLKTHLFRQSYPDIVL